MLNQSDYSFGDKQDGHVANLYPEPYLYLVAGMISAMARTACGNFDNHYVYQKEDGDQFDYVLEDRDMELRITSMKSKTSCWLLGKR